MLINTRAAFDKIFNVFKWFVYLVGMFMNSTYVASTVYAIAVGSGNLYVNIALAVISFSYFVFYIATYWDARSKEVKRSVSRVYRIFNIFARAFTMGIAIYGLYIATERVTLVSVLIAALTVISWIFQITTTLIISFVENRRELIVLALAADFEPVTQPINRVGNFIKKIKGEEPEDSLANPKEAKLRRRLDKITRDFIVKKNNKKADESFFTKLLKQRSKTAEDAEKIKAEEKEPVTK